MKKLLLVTTILTGCSTHLDKGGARVTAVPREAMEEPLFKANCLKVGDIDVYDATSSAPYDPTTALNNARNRTAKSGGNTLVVFDTSSSLFGTSLFGESYDCDYNAVNESKKQINSLHFQKLQTDEEYRKAFYDKALNEEKIKTHKETQAAQQSIVDSNNRMIQAENMRNLNESIKALTPEQKKVIKTNCQKNGDNLNCQTY